MKRHKMDQAEPRSKQSAFGCCMSMLRSTSLRWLTMAFILYLATGFFTVPANEKAIVKRFGRVAMTPLSSGLHFDFPWPFCTVDRVNLNEVRTLTLGDIEVDRNFLQPIAGMQQSSFLTGDKNLLQLRLTVQYRISEDHVADWLYRAASPIQRLQLLIEATTTDLVAHSGVDFVHTQGLADLNNRLLHKVRELVSRLRLGCDVEQITIDRSEPPARVQADFLDVSNARADFARLINDARSHAEKQSADAAAEARRITDVAERDRQTMVSSAQGSADRFTKLIGQIRNDSIEQGRPYDQSRSLVMNRITLDAIREVLEKSKFKIVLDGERQFDLSFPK